MPRNPHISKIEGDTIGVHYAERSRVSKPHDGSFRDIFKCNRLGGREGAAQTNPATEAATEQAEERKRDRGRVLRG